MYCGLAIVDPDKEIVQGLPWSTQQGCRLPWKENCSARWCDRRLELGFIPWLAQHDVRSGAKRQCPYKYNNHFGVVSSNFGVVSTAADHKAGKIEVGPRRIGLCA